MAYDWKSIHAIVEPETRYYRLIGEMHQRQATASDLLEIRDFLLEYGPDEDAFRSLGEALFHATAAGETGFKIWTAWAKKQGVQVTHDQMRGLWLEFGDGNSVVEIEAIIRDESPTDVHADAVEPDFRVSDTAVIRFPEPTLMSFVPEGVYSIRFLDTVYEDVDKSKVVRLLRRGLLLGADILHDGQWVPVAFHPEFGGLVSVIVEEVERVLGDDTHTGRTDTIVGT